MSIIITESVNRFREVSFICDREQIDNRFHEPHEHDNLALSVLIIHFFEMGVPVLVSSSISILTKSIIVIHFLLVPELQGRIYLFLRVLLISIHFARGLFHSCSGFD